MAIARMIRPKADYTRKDDRGPRKAPPKVIEAAPTDRQGQARRPGKNDVNAIGNRKVGGRGPGATGIPSEGEIRMGKASMPQGKLESDFEADRDPAITEYVNRIGQESGAQLRCAGSIHDQGLSDSDEVNAFRLAGRILLRELRN